MRWGILILLGIVLINFVSADNSDTVVNFSIEGCTFYFEDDAIGILPGSCSREGSADGYFYCDDDNYPWETTEVGRGCSLGESSYTPGDNFCCPPGMFCNETEEGEEFRCDYRLVNCFDMDTSEDCADAGCIWLGGVCADGLREYDCGFYDNELDCLDDVYGLGQSGAGAEFCGGYIECNDGTTYSIPEENCSCVWYDLAPPGENCRVKLIGVQEYYDPTGAEVLEVFWCSNVYEVGECIDGRQNVTWYSNSSAVQGFSGTIPEDCLSALGCNDGEAERFCGEPVIKLPGFSLFALFFSLFIIGVCYFLRD